MSPLPHRRTTGVSILGLLLALPIVMLILFLLALGFYETRKAYWDYQVREMCAMDGGDFIFEQVNINRLQLQTWGAVGEVLGLPIEYDNRTEIPFFRRSKDQTILIGSPELMRLETDFIRRSDGKLLGKSVRYLRRGGDLPSWAHESSFICPAPALPIEKAIFIVEENSK